MLNNYMKKILFSLLFAVLGLAVQAQSFYSTNITTAGHVNVLATGNRTALLTLLGTAAGTVTFYDSATTNQFITNGNYASVGAYTTNYTQLYTNTAGIIQTNLIVGLYTYTNTVAAATNIAPSLGVFALQANVPLTVSVDWLLIKGLSAKTTTNTTIVAAYFPLP
jgi:hypothetical protein